VGQQPNIPLEIADLPRPSPHPGSPRRWSPVRPGELGAPGDVPWGGQFGTPGPDAGYATTLAAGRELALAQGESQHDAEAAVAALMVARASHFGRAPVAADAEIAELMLGYAGGGTIDAAARASRVAGAAHRPARARGLVEDADLEALTADAAEVRRRLEAGERLLDL
jgi:hypothetical protein